MAAEIGTTRNYVIDYQITANTKIATDQFKALETPITQLATKMQELQKAFAGVATSIEKIQGLESIRVNVDVSSFKTTLREMEVNAAATAKKIRTLLRGSIMGGDGTFDSALRGVQKSQYHTWKNAPIRASLSELEAEQKALDTFFKVQNARAKLVAAQSKGSNTGSLKAAHNRAIQEVIAYGKEGAALAEQIDKIWIKSNPDANKSFATTKYSKEKGYFPGTAGITKDLEAYHKKIIEQIKQQRATAAQWENENNKGWLSSVMPLSKQAEGFTAVTENIGKLSENIAKLKQEGAGFEIKIGFTPTIATLKSEFKSMMSELRAIASEGVAINLLGAGGAKNGVRPQLNTKGIKYVTPSAMSVMPQFQYAGSGGIYTPWTTAGFSGRGEDFFDRMTTSAIKRTARVNSAIQKAAQEQLNSTLGGGQKDIVRVGESNISGNVGGIADTPLTGLITKNNNLADYIAKVKAGPLGRQLAEAEADEVRARTLQSLFKKNPAAAVAQLNAQLGGPYYQLHNGQIYSSTEVQRLGLGRLGAATFGNSIMTKYAGFRGVPANTSISIPHYWGPVKSGVSQMGFSSAGFTPMPAATTIGSQSLTNLSAQLKTANLSSTIKLVGDVEGLIAQVKGLKLSANVSLAGNLEELRAKIKEAKLSANVKLVGDIAALAAKIKEAKFTASVELVGDTAALSAATKKGKTTPITVQLNADIAALEAKIKAIKLTLPVSLSPDIAAFEAQIKKITIAAKKVELTANVQSLRKALQTSKLSVNVNIKATAKQINTELKRFTPTLQAKIKPIWGGAKAKADEMKSLSEKIPPIKLRLDVSQAMETLNAFIARIREVSNQTIKLGTTAGRAINRAEKTATSARTLTATGRGSRAGGTYSGGMTRPAAKTSWSRALYPLVGNTSLGANTPAAVSMAKGFGVMYAVGGAMSGISNALSQAVDYQNTMETAKAILGRNYKGGNFNGDFNRMENIARQVGMDTKYTAPDVANATRFMAMAGLGINDIEGSLRPVADISLIGDNNLGEVADKLTNVQTAFGIRGGGQMRRLADQMANTFTQTNTDMMMIAESMQYAAPMAHLAGANVGDALAMIGVMGNAGIQASMAGTTLRMMYQNIINPNKNQKKVWEWLGIKRTDANGAPRNMIDILSDIANNKKVGDNNLAEVVSKLFRVTASAGAGQLIEDLRQEKKGGVSLVKMLQVQNAGSNINGLSEDISEKKQNTIAGLWAQVTSAFTEDNVKIFGEFQGFIRSILIDLRDFMRSKEAVNTLRNLWQGIISVAHALADVVTIYGKIFGSDNWLIRGIRDIGIFFIQMQFYLKSFASVAGLVLSVIRPFEGLLSKLGLVTASTGTTAIAQRIGATSGKLALSTGVLASTVATGTAAPLLSAQNPITKSYYNPASFAPVPMSMYGGYNAKALRLNSIGRLNVPTPLKMYGALQNEAALARASYMTPILPWPTGMNGYSHPSQYVERGRMRSLESMYRSATRRRSGTGIELGNARGAAFGLLDRARREAPQVQVLTGVAAQKFGLDAMRMQRGAPTPSYTYSNPRAGRDGMYALLAGAGLMPLHGQSPLMPDAMRRKAIQERAARIYTFGNRFSNAFSAGRAMGTFSMANLWNTLKGGLMSVVSGLGTALGALVSPLGLLTLAIGGTITAILLARNKLKEDYDKGLKESKQDSDTGKEARKSLYKNIGEMRGKFISDVAEIMPESIGGNLTAQQKYKAYQEAFGKITPGTTSKESMRARINSYTAGLMGGNYANIFGDKANMYSPEAIDALAGPNGGYKKRKRLTGDSYRETTYTYNNAIAAQNRMAQAAIYHAGANNPAVIAAQGKIGELRQSLLTGKINEEQFKAAAIKIRDAVANPNKMGLIDASNWTKNRAYASKNWSNTNLYQQGGYNLLTSEIEGQKGSITGYLNGIAKLKSGIETYSNNWWDAISHVVGAMRTSINIAGQRVDIAFNTLPNGRIDTSSIVAQIRRMVNNFNLTLSDFSQMVTGLYGELAKLGVVDGKYFSSWRKFTQEQTMHNVVSAKDAGDYWDKYIGGPNAKWGNMSRQEYIDYISNPNNRGRAAKERALIRRVNANAAADKGKKDYDDSMKTLANNINSNAENTNSNNDNSGKSVPDFGRDSGYGNKYGKTSGRPTQITINIDQLAKFDGAQFLTADEQKMQGMVRDNINTALMSFIPMLSGAMQGVSTNDGSSIT